MTLHEFDQCIVIRYSLMVDTLRVTFLSRPRRRQSHVQNYNNMLQPAVKINPLGRRVGLQVGQRVNVVASCCCCCLSFSFTCTMCHQPVNGDFASVNCYLTPASHLRLPLSFLYLIDGRRHEVNKFSETTSLLVTSRIINVRFWEQPEYD